MRKKIFKAFFIFIIFWSIIFIIDYTRIKDNYSPIFCIEVYDTDEYSYSVGILYGVYEKNVNKSIIYNNNSPKKTHFVDKESRYSIVPWFIKTDK